MYVVSFGPMIWKKGTWNWHWGSEPSFLRKHLRFAAWLDYSMAGAAAAAAGEEKEEKSGCPSQSPAGGWRGRGSSSTRKSNRNSTPRESPLALLVLLSYLFFICGVVSCQIVSIQKREEKKPTIWAEQQFPHFKTINPQLHGGRADEKEAEEEEEEEDSATQQILSLWRFIWLLFVLFHFIALEGAAIFFSCCAQWLLDGWLDERMKGWMDGWMDG